MYFAAVIKRLIMIHPLSIHQQVPGSPPMQATGRSVPGRFETMVPELWPRSSRQHAARPLYSIPWRKCPRVMLRGTAPSSTCRTTAAGSTEKS